MIVKAIHLLHRWLGRDVGAGMLPDGETDSTLDDETNDLLLAYSVPRAEHDQAVLDAVAAAPEVMLRTWTNSQAYVERCLEKGTGAFSLALGRIAEAEQARRQALAEANEIRRGLTAAAPEVRAAARAALRRLESLR